jgi:hypothetical protein
MAGAVAIVIVLVVVIPVLVLVSGAIVAALLGGFLRYDVEERFEGSELIELGR